MIEVLNLASGDRHYYSGTTRPEAVVAAYAASLGDWNTWGYQTKYGGLLKVGKYSFSCGDFAALKLSSINLQALSRSSQ